MKYEPNKRGFGEEDILCPKCGRPTYYGWGGKEGWKRIERCVCDKPIKIGEIRDDGIETKQTPEYHKAAIDQLMKYGFTGVTINPDHTITTTGHFSNDVNKYLVNLTGGEHVFVYHYAYGELIQLLNPDGHYYYRYTDIPPGAVQVDRKMGIWSDLILVVMRVTGLKGENKKVLYRAPDFETQQEKKKADLLAMDKRGAIGDIEKRKSKIHEKELEIKDLEKDIEKRRKDYAKMYGEECPA